MNTTAEPGRYSVETPASDPGFYVVYCVMAPIYFTGLALNPLVLFLMLRQTRTKRTRMDRLLACVVGTTGSYALFQIVCQGLVLLVVNSPAYGSFAAAGSSILVAVITSANVMLAMERFLALKFPNLDTKESLIYYLFIVAVLSEIVVVLLWTYSTSNAVHDIQPASHVQYLVWMISMAVFFVVSVAASAFFYISTYIFISNRLHKASMEGQVASAHLEKLEKRVLLRCIVMSSSILICYLPRCIVQIFVNSETSYFSLATAIANIFAALDVIVTPGLMIYFLDYLRVDLAHIFLFRKIKIGESNSSSELNRNIAGEARGAEAVLYESNTQLESPTTDEGFYIIYGVIAPIYIIGLVFNAIALVVMFRTRDSTRLALHRTATIVIAITFLYAFFQIIGQGFVPLVYNSEAYGSFIGAGSSILVICLAASNVLLAIERLFAVKHPEISDSQARQYYGLLFFVVVVYSCVIVWVFVTSNTVDHIDPSTHVQYIVWVVTMASYLVFAVVFTVILYTWTYFAHVEKLALIRNYSPSLSPNDTQRIELSVLRRCIMVSTAILICYTPRLIVQIFVDSDVVYAARATSFANIFAALDVVITPALILFFPLNLRDELMDVICCGRRRGDLSELHVTRLRIDSMNRGLNSSSTRTMSTSFGSPVNSMQRNSGQRNTRTNGQTSSSMNRGVSDRFPLNSLNRVVNSPEIAVSPASEGEMSP
ncbi:hypothetical protein HK100_009444 [Physocladia obscura]|uniref:G-protein coupled receptors family 1 profile domain-containing protein n=1 Tax=Physocladia obscura TaxID=109957 RepID=A0AAD5XHM3_9FUNG|nr:hypothetical protein HK100_009444 [Physocladia obscura]